MNIQTERLENHTARFTVELDTDRLEQAKQTAARQLAKRVNIPGFRKGKVPYKILVNYVGEGALLDDAVEILGNEIYKEALDQSGVDPYGPGELEDFTVDPAPVFKFVVPLQPVVNLNDYRSVRVEFVPPVVEDEDVNNSLKMLQEEHALVEESHKPAALGNRVTVDIHAVLLPQAGAETEEETASPAPDEGADETEAHDHEHEHAHPLEGEGEPLIHQHDAQFLLDAEHGEPAPGFRDALIGANVDETREFELTYPNDPDEYEDLAGRNARFHVTIKKVETITLPALNDDFAARMTKLVMGEAPERPEGEEEKSLTLLELRMRVRENLQKAAEQRARSEYAQQALEKMVEQADISYPEAMVSDQIEDYLERVDRDLRQRGLTLDDYMRITGKTRENLYEDYRETAVSNLERSLVLREIVQGEDISVDEPAVSEEVERILDGYGAQGEQLRSLFDNPNMRASVRSDLLEQRVFDRIVAIAKGEAPELNATPALVESDEQSAQGDGE